MKSAFVQLCEDRDIDPEEWKKSLKSPIISEKALLDMDDDELEEHYNKVEERAEFTMEDRALIILERTREGALEAQARKAWGAMSKDGKITADQVSEMFDMLKFDVTNTELHFILRKFDATEGFEMLPDVEMTERQWLWMVGELQMLKNFYRTINAEAFEVCYESMIQNLKMQKDAGLEGTDEWPHIKPTGPGWFMTGGVKPGYTGPLKPFVWGLQPEIEDEMMRQMEFERDDDW